MKLLATQAMGGSQFIAPKIEAGLYEGFILRLTGTGSAAANPIKIGEIGRIRYSEHGMPVVDCDFDMLHFYNELKSGDMECTESAAVSQPFAYSAYIPRHYQDGVLHAITEDDKPQFVLAYGPNAISGITAGTVELYGIPRTVGVQKYRLRIAQIDYPYTGASTPVETITQENILGLYFDRQGTGPNVDTLKASLTVDADFDELSVKKDGTTIVSAKVAAIQAKTNLYNRIEAPYTRMIECEMVSDHNDISEQLSDEVVCQFRTLGATTIRCLIISADLTPDKHVATEAGSGQVLQAALMRKQNLNRILAPQSVALWGR